MKVLIAPDKFKGSLSAAKVCAAITQGIHKWKPETEVVSLPLADGGEGSLEVLEEVLNLETISLTVRDPLFRSRVASYKMESTTAYIEMAAASGLPLLEVQDQNPLFTTSFGTGELIRDALGRGAKEIYLFIGGSATNDGGMGMAEALGYQFLDWEGEVLSPIGENLARVRSINRAGVMYQVQRCQFVVVSDVQNPLYGPEGAAYVYAGQKGADAQGIQILDTGLQHFAHIIKEDFGVEIADQPGAGAAGGMGAGAMVFLNARMQAGIESILNLVNFDQALEGVDLVITGEGKVDEQTLAGKVVYGVARHCQARQIPAGLLCGTLKLPLSKVRELGLEPALALKTEKIDLPTAMERAEELLSIRAYQLMLIVENR
jgi:glycerate kinase